MTRRTPTSSGPSPKGGAEPEPPAVPNRAQETRFQKKLPLPPTFFFLNFFYLRSGSLKYAAFHGCLELSPVPPERESPGSRARLAVPHGARNAAAVEAPEDALRYPSAAHPSPPRLRPETLKLIPGIENHGRAAPHVKAGWETPASEEEDGDRPWGSSRRRVGRGLWWSPEG